MCKSFRFRACCARSYFAGAAGGSGAGATAGGDGLEGLEVGAAGGGADTVGAAVPAFGAVAGAGVLVPVAFGLTGTGLVAPGGGTECCTEAASSRIDFGCSPGAFEPRYASSRLLIMKIAAKIAVARDSAVLAPRAPKTVPDAPAPKPAPASAPLPRCSRTRPMIAAQQIT
jgi:hypothetical protein